MKKILLLLLCAMVLSCFPVEAKKKVRRRKARVERRKTPSMTMSHAIYCIAGELSIKASGDISVYSETFFIVSLPEYYSFQLVKLDMSLIDVEYSDVKQITAWSDYKCLVKVDGRIVEVEYRPGSEYIPPKIWVTDGE